MSKLSIAGCARRLLWLFISAGVICGTVTAVGLLIGYRVFDPGDSATDPIAALPTVSATATLTPHPSETATETQTPTPTETATKTPKPSLSPTVTSSVTPSLTDIGASIALVVTNTRAPTDTLTATITLTPTATATEEPGVEMVRVMRVVDGDTIEVLLPDGAIEDVRYIGMDTPERNERCFSEATDYNAQLVEGRELVMTRDVSNRDRFGRLLRYVFVDGEMVNAQLVREGYAVALRFPPDTRYADEFDEWEAEARSTGVGCLNASQVAAATATRTHVSSETWFIAVTGEVNVRVCPRLDCEVATRLSSGDAIVVMSTGLTAMETGVRARVCPRACRACF